MRWVLVLVLSVMVSLSDAPNNWHFHSASAQERTKRISFASGRSSQTVRGQIVGYDGIDYLIRVSGGQRLAAEMRTDNRSSYFNILPFGADEALFIGSSQGDFADVIVPKSGDYVIRVYLMRNAARRDEVANFSLDVEVTGGRVDAVAPDFADGLSGGPDFWAVANVPNGDRLNIRAEPTTLSPTIAQLRNGTVLRNLGCRMNGRTRWCRVERPDGNLSGWASGRFLVEAGG